MLTTRTPGEYCLDCDSKLVLKEANKYYCPDCRCFVPPKRRYKVNGRQNPGSDAKIQGGSWTELTDAWNKK